YKIFVTMAIAAFEAENGKFEFYDEDSGINFSKILKKFKPFSFREKLSFIGLFLLLIGTLISSCFYYIFGLHKLRKNKK
ncbi:MAG: hypothetical protein MJ189_05980, partial [Coriobacteriales bacterium]|nr:hypothetical protein [Coriobacteriales bacterium]